MTDKNNKDEAPAAPPPQHTRMAIPQDAPPGIELDGQGNVIPFKQRAPEDQARAKEHAKTHKTP